MTLPPASEQTPLPAPANPAPALANPVRSSPSKRTIIWSVSVAVSLAVALVVAYLVWGLERPEIADGETPVVVGTGASATLTPARDWQVLGKLSDRVTFTTPDGVYRVTVEAPAAGAPGDLLAADLAALPASTNDARDPSLPRTETLRSGLAIAHAMVGDALMIAVGNEHESVLIQAGATRPERGDSASEVQATYRPALAALLDTLTLN